MLQPWRFTPSSIDDRAFWGRVATDPALAAMRAEQAAALAAPSDPRQLSVADWLRIRRANDRGPTDAHLRHILGGIAAATVACCQRGPEGDDDRLLEWYWQAAHQPTWTMSAHLGGRLPRCDRHDIDLGACMIAVSLAEGLETLAPWLRRQADDFIPAIVAAIDLHVVGPYGAGAEVWWEGRSPLNNWIGVCAGSILAACRSLAALGAPRPQAESRALAALGRYFADSFTADGECDEGMGYWSYGMAYACLGLSRLDPSELERVGGERIRRCADYPRRVHLGGERFIAANDGLDRCQPNPGLVPWLAAATGSPWLRAWAEAPCEPAARSFPLVLRGLDARLRLADDGAVAPLPPPADASLLPDQQIAVLRRGRLAGILTGGHNAESHNHNDLGNVQVMLDGEFVLPELGFPSPYPADFFGPRRYTYLAASSRGHSCPLVAGCEQRPGREAQAQVVAWEPGAYELELAAAYPSEAGLISWRRRLALEGAGLRLDDRFAAGPGAVVEEVFWCAAPPELLPDADALTVRCGGLRLRVTPAPAASTVEVIDPAALRLVGPGGPLHRLALRFAAGADGRLEVRTGFVPA